MNGIKAVLRSKEALMQRAFSRERSESEAKSIGNEHMAVVAKQQKPFVNAVMRARLKAMSAAAAFKLVGNKFE